MLAKANSSLFLHQKRSSSLQSHNCFENKAKESQHPIYQQKKHLQQSSFPCPNLLPNTDLAVAKSPIISQKTSFSKSTSEPSSINSPKTSATRKYLPGLTIALAISALATKISQELGYIITNTNANTGSGVSMKESISSATAHNLDAMSYMSFDTISEALLTLSSNSPVPAVPIAILLGILVRNFILNPKSQPAPSASSTSPSPSPPSSVSSFSQFNRKNILDTLLPGITWVSANFLRLGVIFIGLKLSISQVITAGPISVAGALCGIAISIKLVSFLAKKFQIPDKTASLIAAGTAICGVTAIMACAPAIKATERDISIAVANVLLFGLIGMNIFPYLGHYAFTLPFGLTDGSVGTFLGLSVHDTSQVIGAGTVYSAAFSQVPGAAEVLPLAALTKLCRNLMLAGVIPYFAIKYASKAAAAAAAATTTTTTTTIGTNTTNLPSKKVNTLDTVKQLAKNAYKYTPGFVYLFLLAVLIRSLGDSTVETPEEKKERGELDSTDVATSTSTSTSTSTTTTYKDESLVDDKGTNKLVFGILTLEHWKQLIKVLTEPIATTILLTSSMAALGLSTNLSSLKGVGYKPFIVGGCAASAVAFSGFCITYLSILLKQREHHESSLTEMLQKDD